jgi:DNA polymerase-1
MDSPLSRVELELVDSLDKALELKRWLGQRRETPLGVDTETTGFNAFKAGERIRLGQLGDMRKGWAIPWDQWGGVFMEAVTRYEGPLVFHNSSFDIKWMQKHAYPTWKAPWDRIHDTMTMAHLYDPTRPRGLKPLADRIVDPRASAGSDALSDGMKQQGWTWATVPFNFAPYWVYAALDPVLTVHVWEKLHKEIETEFAGPYDLEMNAARICTNMMEHGALIDVPYVEKAIHGLREYASQCRDWLRGNYGITSPQSGGQIQRAFERLGVPILFHTAGGAASFDKDALQFYINEFPQAEQLATTIRAVRRVEKTIGTYLENFLEMMDSGHRVHPSLWVAGAKTSRMSCSDPNLHNLTRDDKYVRGSIIAQEGYVLMSIDADQIEARLTAHFSQDPGLIEAFHEADRTGKDFFSIIASEIFSTVIEKKDPRRQRTKNTFYGKIYGAQTPKMAATAGIPVQQMAEFHGALNARYPGLNAYMEATMAEGRHNLVRGMPSVVTPTGRRLMCTPGKEYTLANFKAQGHAAEVLKMGGTRLDAAGYGQYLVIPVHDEFILEAPASQAEAILHEAEEALADRTSYSVPITWGGEIMKERWVKS